MKMKYTDLQDKSLKELQDLLKEKKVLLFTLKNKLKLMQLTNTAEVRDVKKDIARILTAISAKKDA
jgi:large subunit ribosomal protein L29